MILSVIVPTLNEEKNIPACLRSLRDDLGGEVIVVDGDSADATVAVALEANGRVWHGPRGLAQQCNFAAARARGDVLFFLSADCVAPTGYERAIAQVMQSPYAAGGTFQLDLDDPGLIYRAITFGGNFRSRYLRIGLGDQGLFVRKSVFTKVGGMRENSRIPFLQLCTDLKREGEFRILNAAVKSSSRKWREHGVLRTVLHHNLTYLKFRAERDSPSRPT